MKSQSYSDGLGEKPYIVLLTRRGGIAYGVFPEVPLHKKEHEYILKNIGVKVEYGEC